MKVFAKWCSESLLPNMAAIRKQIFFALMMALSVVATVMLSFPLNAQITPSAALASELRGVWLTNIDSDVLFERDRLKTSLQKLDKLNFNTVYPAVWNWGYTLYPSKVAAKVIGRAIDPPQDYKGEICSKK